MDKGLDLQVVLRAIQAIGAVRPEHEVMLGLAHLGNRERKRVLANISAAQKALEILSDTLDPIQAPPFVLDLTDHKTMGTLIGRWLEGCPDVDFDALPLFYGSGVYAMYYRGDFPAYEPIRNTRVPIYVGKADPADPKAKTSKEQGVRLCSRLREHAKSIESVENLRLADFRCRYLGACRSTS